MVLKLVFLSILVQAVVLASKATAKLACVKIGCVLNLYLVADLVVNNLPILALDSIVHLLVVVPVDVLVLAFSYFGYFLKVLESVTFPILVERLTLSQLLQDLEPCRQASVALNIKTELRLETSWRNNLYAAVLAHFLFVVELFDVVNRALELLLGGPEHGHLFNFVELAVDILGLHERVLQGLVN